MTPHQIELVKKLDQEVQNLSILMQHTEVGDSLTLKDIRHYLYLLNKEVTKQPSVQDYLNGCPTKLDNTSPSDNVDIKIIY